MEVFEIGTTVWVGRDGKIPGVILSINISGTNHVSYQVSWWDGFTRKVEWLTEYEFTLESPRLFKIGFINDTTRVSGSQDSVGKGEAESGKD